jgi:hypothetical protein
MDETTGEGTDLPTRLCKDSETSKKKRSSLRLTVMPPGWKEEEGQHLNTALVAVRYCVLSSQKMD